MQSLADGGAGHPQIFAKLDAEGEQPAVENQISADGDGLPQSVMLSGAECPGSNQRFS